MRTRGDLLIWVNRLFSSSNVDEALAAEQQITKIVADVAQNFDGSEPIVERSELAPNSLPKGTKDYPVSRLSDEQVLQLNSLLPWAAVTLDEQQRHIGSPWSDIKRATPQSLVDKRHVALNKVYPFAGKHVLEVGCFEGIHTISCMSLGARVTAVEGRIENLLKTLTRLWCYDYRADVKRWDLEEEAPADIPSSWDLLHHVGVLYHLSDPVRHLQHILSRTSEAVLLDTHVATDAAAATASYEVNGQTYAYYHHHENTSSPFAGVRDHAKWMLVEDIEQLLKSAGFNDIHMNSDRIERNGRRITLWAFKK